MRATQRPIWPRFTRVDRTAFLSEPRIPATRRLPLGP
jgi:hypothetical protein